MVRDINERIKITKKVAPILFGIAFTAILLWAIFTVKFVSWDFRNNLWAPARLVWQAESAYNINLLVSNSNAVWFPQAIGLFLPLGLLPEPVATNVWLGFNIVLLLAMIWFLPGRVAAQKPNFLQFGILAFGVFIFPSTIRHLILGQIDILLMLLLILGVYAVERRQWILGGFCFAIALTKPQLCILVLPCMIADLLLIKKQAWQAGKLVLVTGLFSAALTLPLWISNSAWLQDFLTNVQGNPPWIQPNVYSMLHNRFGQAGIVPWFMLYVLVLGISFQIWRRQGPHKAILWCLALTTLISPYSWSWDFVLLLPLCIDSAVRLKRQPARLVLAGFTMASVIFSMLTLRSTAGLDDALWYVPFLMIVGVLISKAMDQKEQLRRQV